MVIGAGSWARRAYAYLLPSTEEELHVTEEDMLDMKEKLQELQGRLRSYEEDKLMSPFNFLILADRLFC